jgi:TatD DNase family protein
MAASLIDTHCHLDPAYFPAGPDEVLARAAAASVAGFVVVGVGSDLAPARAAVALASRLPDRIGAAVGVHPHDATSLDPAALAELATLAGLVAFVLSRRGANLQGAIIDSDGGRTKTL